MIKSRSRSAPQIFANCWWALFISLYIIFGLSLCFSTHIEAKKQRNFALTRTILQFIVVSIIALIVGSIIIKFRNEIPQTQLDEVIVPESSDEGVIFNTANNSNTAIAGCVITMILGSFVLERVWIWTSMIFSLFRRLPFPRPRRILYSLVFSPCYFSLFVLFLFLSPFIGRFCLIPFGL